MVYNVFGYNFVTLKTFMMDFKQKFKETTVSKKELTPEEEKRMEEWIAKETVEITKDIEFFRLKVEHYTLSVQLGALTPNEVPGLLGLELLARHNEAMAKAIHFKQLKEQGERQAAEEAKKKEAAESIIKP